MVNVVQPEFEIIAPMEDQYRLIELAARVTHESQDKITDDGSSAKTLVQSLMDKRHTAMIEFGTECFEVDEDFFHEICFNGYEDPAFKFMNFSVDDVNGGNHCFISGNFRAFLECKYSDFAYYLATKYPILFDDILVEE
jgi:hypothetical protein